MLTLTRLCHRLLSTGSLFAAAFVLTTSALAQEKQYTENKSDLALRSEARIDPATLGMSLEIPLGGVPGRAGTSLPISVRYSSKQWRMKYLTWSPDFSPKVWTRPKFSENAWSGWTSSLEPPRIEYTLDQKYEWDGNTYSDNPNADHFGIWRMFRIHLYLPDGSSHELRKSDAPTNDNPPDYTAGTYYSTDGSRLRFEADSGVLYLPDGSRYFFSAASFTRFNNETHSGAWATQYIDRNGNTINYSLSNVTNTLGRTFENPLNDPNNIPTVRDQSYAAPGVGNVPLNYTLRWRLLNDVLGMPVPAADMPYTGDNKCAGPNNYPPRLPFLFASDFSSKACADENRFNPVVLAEIELPNGQKYQFNYTIYGEIEKIIYPAGGYERFAYAAVPALSDLVGPYAQSNRGVVQRLVSATGNANDETLWQYSGGDTVRITAPDNTYTERSLYNSVGELKFGFNNPLEGMAYDERSYNTSNEMLRRTLTEWQVTGPVGANPALDASRDPRTIKQVQILLDTAGDALAAATTTLYDGDLNPVSTSAYDYFSVDATTAKTAAISSTAFSLSARTPVRTEETTYLVNDPLIDPSVRQLYRDRQLLGLPSSSRVKNSAYTIVAQSEIKYDEAAYAPLAFGAVTNWIDPGTTVRGLPTTTRSWLNTTGGWLETHAQYDQCGSVRNTWDAKGNQSQVEYSPLYHYAYPTLTRTPAPGMDGSPTPLESTSVYDFTTGRPKQTVDANNVTTKFEYFDSLNRLSQTVRAYGTGIQNQTSVSYDDYNHTITATTDLNTINDNALVSKVIYDGLGRTTETRQYEGGTNYIAAQQQYDSLGRAFKSSNPFRPWQGESAVWTTTGFDALGRVSSVTTPDNAVVSTAYGGNIVTVTDQAGKKRKSVTDGLGRLKEVYEDPTGLNYLTSYQYDVLDDLTRVTQHTQPARVFEYDSLKRLTSASNPESGTISYQYDPNGNLTQKTDARGVTTTYTYDALNRNSSVGYSDGTLGIGRAYDHVANGKGRLSWEYRSNWSNFGTLTSYAYDVLGRIKNQYQSYLVAGSWQTYTTNRFYDLAGHVTAQGYPSGNSVNYGYDSAGRTSSFIGNLGGPSRNYSTGIIYSPLGGITKEQFGTDDAPVYHKSFYNSRGQLAEIMASTSDTGPANRGQLVNWYSSQCGGANCNNSDNNGNLRQQDTLIPHEQANPYTSWSQQFDYDNLNRLERVKEFNSGGQLWQQEYVYDRWGNRTIHQTNTWGPATGPAIPKPNFGVDPANNNRLTVPGGYTMSYDGAGNVNYDNYTGQGQRSYDAENRMTQAWGNNQWQTYAYDASGQRVSRKVDGVETWLVYGMDGELVAEYPANAGVGSPQKEYGYRNGQLLVTAGAEESPNLALGKTATQSSDEAGGVAGRAVDGNTNGNWANGSVTHTGLNAQAWWQVDLGGMKAVQSVQVWNRTDCCAERLTNFNVLLLDNNQTVVASTNVSGAAGTPTTVPVSGTARYVKVQLVGTNYLSLAEVKVWGGSSGDSDIQWLVTDQLGTPRMIFDQTGALANVKRHDYLPFGEELIAYQGLRTPGLGYAGDNVRQKFTSKERDIETGLDYFGARYYSSTQGRFTSADDFLNDTRVADPASWNLYAYVRNNPLRYVDPLGQTIQETADKKHKLTKDEKKAIIKDLQAKTGLSSIEFDKNGRITYDRSEKAKGGSAQLRQAMTGAIDDTKNVFQLGDYSGSEKIQFAATDAGTTVGNTGVTEYEVKIDFADFRDARNLSDPEALSAFSLGLTLYHEIDHKVSYDPSNPVPAAGRLDEGSGGVIADVNVAQSQLGLATRAPGSHTGRLYSGLDSRYKNTYQIQFNNASGKSKFVRWKQENERQR